MREAPDFLWGDTTPTLQVRPHRSAGPNHPGLPAETGLWVFILGDMTIFGLFFIVFSWEARTSPAVVSESTVALIQPIGVLNTLVLLASSYFVVLALHAHRQGAFAIARRFVTYTLTCAAAFAGLKVIEYYSEISAGHTPGSNTFFTFYYVLTGVHLLHVLIGAVLLWVWRSWLRDARPFADKRAFVEASAVYWHMVDLLWIVIFTLLYLAGTS